MWSDFTFNGKHSLNDMGLYTELVARPLFAEPKTVYEDIAGCDGEVNFNTANPRGRMCFKPRIIELQCHFGSDISSADYKDKGANIASWLATGEDMRLTFDDEPGIYYMAHGAKLFNIEDITDSSGTFPLVFKCQPFRFSTMASAYAGQSTASIANDGYYTPLKINVTCTAPNGITVRTSVGGKSLTVNTPLNNNTVKIDTGKMTVTVNGVSVLHQCEGEFFELAPGENIIDVDGNFQSTPSMYVSFTKRYL